MQAGRDQHRCGDPSPGKRRWEQGQQQLVLAGVDARAQPQAEDDQREPVDARVEHAQVELALSDQPCRRSDPVRDRAAQGSGRSTRGPLSMEFCGLLLACVEQLMFELVGRGVQSVLDRSGGSHDRSLKRLLERWLADDDQRRLPWPQPLRRRREARAGARLGDAIHRLAGTYEPSLPEI